MAFDLTKAAGLDKIMSNLDTLEITMVSMDLLDANKKNFFVVDDVEDLKESIQVNGILQPLNLVRSGDRYRIIAGHRRFKAAGLAGLKEVPAIILPEMSEAMEWFMLIKTNTTARELTHAEKAEAAIRMKKTLVQMKKEGVKIPGKLRDIVAKQMEISATEFARMEVIEKNLNDDFKKMWKGNSIDASCAYELAKLPDADQQALLSKMTRNGCRMSAPIVKDYVLQKKCKDWSCQDCPFPRTAEEKEKRGKGWKFPCHHLEKLQIRHWSSDGACTCCAKCGKAFKCLDACPGAKVAACEDNRKKQIERDRQKAEAETERKNKDLRLLNASRLANIGPAVIPLIDKGGISMESIAEWWSTIHSGMCPNYDLDDYDAEEVSLMLHPQCIEDADYSLTSFIAFCEAVDRTPNALLGYDDPLSGGWHPYPETCPDNGQKVIVFRRVMNMALTGDFIYYNGDFFVNDDEFDPEYDAPANVPGVSAWIEFPEV